MANYKLYKIVKAEKIVIDAFLAELREDDRRELFAIGNNVRKELEESINFSAECWAAFTDDDKPIVIFGRTMLPERDGALIWCVGTDRIEDYWYPFLRHSRNILRKWAEEYGTLFNVVAEFNNPHMRWLSWLGAKFGKEIEVNGETFLPFTIESEDI